MKNSGTSRHTYVVGREQFAIIPVRHVGRVISGFVILLVLGWLAFEVAKNPDFQFGVVTNYLFNPVVLRGVGLTASHRGGDDTRAIFGSHRRRLTPVS